MSACITNTTVRIHTEDSSGLFENFFQLLLAPSSYGPLQGSVRTLGHSAGYFLHHKLPREARRSEDDQMVGPAGRGFNTSHDDGNQT